MRRTTKGFDNWYEYLLQSLDRMGEILPQKNCVCLPDFFVDTLFFFGKPFSKLLEGFRANIRGEGRNIYAKGGKIVPGGNSFNMARGIANLGCSTYFIGETDEIGSMIASRVASKIPTLHLLLHTSDRLNCTTSVEVKDDTGKIHNIMLSVSHAINDWGPDELNSAAVNEISKAHLIFLSNWGINSQGNELLRKILELAPNNVMFDPGTVFVGKKRISPLLDLLKDVNIVSLNFDEFNFLEKQSHLVYPNKPLNSRLENVLFFIHGHEKIRVLHGQSETEIPTLEIEPVVQTGLGDFFAAGVAAGLLSKLPAPVAAGLGSAVAGYYATSLKLPYLKDLKPFLLEGKFRSLLH